MNLGFIGLGNMGAPMATNLLRAGHHLTVHDIRRDSAAELERQGAVWAPTPKEVASASSITFTALPGPSEIEHAVLGPDGLLEGASASDMYVDMSTSTPQSIKTIASVASKKNVDVLDAPVSGGVRGARKATLVIMVGGERAAYMRCESLLKLLGGRVVHMGGLGTGYVTKLVNNFMGMSNALASMEAMVLGTKAGVEPEALLDVVNSGTGASHMTATLYKYLVLGRNFQPTRFSMQLGAKDLRLALDLADQLGVRARVGSTVARALEEAVDSGRGEDDFSTYITILEEEAGVEVRA